MTPLVSVIIPVYNVENYIRECVTSVVRQSYKNIEIILVDDGSTDSSGKLCDEIVREHDFVRTIHKTNGGLSSARNEGMKIASGEYYFFLDSDDYIPQNSIELLVTAIMDKGADLSISRMERTSKRDLYASINILDAKVSVIEPNVALVKMLYGDDFSTSACGKLFKRELFQNLEFPDGKFSEDLFTIYKTILNSSKVCYIPTVGYYYYYREEGSIVVSRYSIKHLEAIEAVDNIKVDTVGMGIEVDRAISSQYINVIYDIATRRPKRNDFLDDRIVSPLKNNRASVVLDTKSPFRLRLFALFSYVGPVFAINCVFVYNYLKWKISRS